jgi:hypothetical protein
MQLRLVSTIYTAIFSLVLLITTTITADPWAVLIFGFRFETRVFARVLLEQGSVLAGKSAATAASSKATICLEL